MLKGLSLLQLHSEFLGARTSTDEFSGGEGGGGDTDIQPISNLGQVFCSPSSDP